jgi:hypothetical protein
MMKINNHFYKHQAKPFIFSSTKALSALQNRIPILPNLSTTGNHSAHNLINKINKVLGFESNIKDTKVGETLENKVFSSSGKNAYKNYRQHTEPFPFF